MFYVSVEEEEEEREGGGQSRVHQNTLGFNQGLEVMKEEEEEEKSQTMKIQGQGQPQPSQVVEKPPIPPPRTKRQSAIQAHKLERLKVHTEIHNG